MPRQWKPRVVRPRARQSQDRQCTSRPRLAMPTRACFSSNCHQCPQQPAGVTKRTKPKTTASRSSTLRQARGVITAWCTADDFLVVDVCLVLLRLNPSYNARLLLVSAGVVIARMTCEGLCCRLCSTLPREPWLVASSQAGPTEACVNT